MATKQATVMKSNGDYVERIEIEYDTGGLNRSKTIKANIHLCDKKEDAYQFDSDEVEHINGFIRLKLETS